MHVPVKIGIVGLRFGGSWIQRNYNKIKHYLTIKAVCDYNPERLIRFTTNFPFDGYSSLKEMLMSADIEAVALFTPPEGRAELVRLCAAAGKHILSTKPFELSSTAAFEVLEEVRSSGIVVHLNSPAPELSQDLKQLDVWRREYKLGNPVAADWETYIKYDEKADGTWQDSNTACPVAPIFRIGIYGINELISMLGNVSSVQVASSRLFTGRPTPDNAKILLEFENGAIGSVFASFCIDDGQCFPGFMRIHYEHGTVCKRQINGGDPNNRAKFDAVEMTLQCKINGVSHHECVRILPENRSGEYQLENFVQAIRTGNSAPGVDTAEAVANGIAVIEAMTKSAAENKKVQVKSLIRENPTYIKGRQNFHQYFLTNNT
jgi:predicted dehydrogenase